LGSDTPQSYGVVDATQILKGNITKMIGIRRRDVQFSERSKGRGAKLFLPVDESSYIGDPIDERINTTPINPRVFMLPITST